MSSVKEYHDMAMEFADLGIRNRANGDPDLALSYFEQALDFELAAISELGQSDGLLWSMLHRSAGTLALDCREFRQAEQLVAVALAGDPQPDIAQELRELFHQVHFHTELLHSGVSLGEDEMELSLSGPNVGYGVVSVEEIYGRIGSSSQLIYRTVERKRERRFRERGSPTKDIREGYQTFVTASRAGSFAVTLKLGRPTGQLAFPGMLDAADIIDEFMDLMELVNRDRVDEIRERIPDPAYQRNFFGLAKKIAPDGDRIRQVGFTVSRGEDRRSIEFTKPMAEFQIPVLPEQADADSVPVEIRGILRYADATRGTGNQIRVIDSDQVTHRVSVPPGMMNDIVRPMWDSTVTISGWRNGDVIELQDISADEVE